MTCSSFTCPTDYVLKEDASSIRGNDQIACCSWLCQGFSCPANYIVRVEPGDDTSLCCDKLCSGYKCPEAYRLKVSASNTIGDDQATCCDQTSNGYECPLGYVLKSCISGKVENDRATCCEEQEATEVTTSDTDPLLVACAIGAVCILLCICLSVAWMKFRPRRVKSDPPASTSNENASLSQGAQLHEHESKGHVQGLEEVATNPISKDVSNFGGGSSETNEQRFEEVGEVANVLAPGDARSETLEQMLMKLDICDLGDDWSPVISI